MNGLLTLFVIMTATSRFCCGVVHQDFPPTASPAPTESPAPSPSPSETPTDTQAPTLTLYPSAAPSHQPSPSPPTSSPTEDPTESPAPSPSPSETPTLAPSLHPSSSFPPTTSPSFIPTAGPSAFPTTMPSILPTNSPTITHQPTMMPSLSPTNSPSISFAPSNGPIGFVATGIKIPFQGTKGLIIEKDIKDFEDTLLNFLRVNIQNSHIPDVVSIKFTHVEVTDQLTVSQGSQANATSVEETSSLEITFSVFALVLLQEEGLFDLKTLIEVFFSDGARISELREILDLSTMVLEHVTHTTSGETLSKESAGRIGSGMRGDGRGKEDGGTVSLLGAIAGILLSAIGGSSAVYVYFRGRKNVEHPTPKLNLTSEVSSEEYDSHKSCSDSSVHVYEDNSEPSTPGILIHRGSAYHEASSESRVPVVSNGTFKSTYNRPIKLLAEEEVYYENESTHTSESGGLAFYKPALMSMESNIEIPDSPTTDHGQSQFSLKEDPSTVSSCDKSADISTKEKKTEDNRKIASSISTVASFFSPRRRGGKRKKEDSDSRVGPIGLHLSSTSSARTISPKSPLRQRIQTHDVCTENEMHCTGYSTCRSNSSMRSATEILNSNPIRVMNEISYLYSTGSQDLLSIRSRPDPETIMRRDPSTLSRRSIQRIHSIGGVNGARVDYSGLVGSQTGSRKGSRFAITDEEQSDYASA